MQHFRSYLEGTEKPKPNEKIPDNVIQSKRKITDVVYVKKWMRTRHAIMFRLSNKVVQVNFQDHTEIMLSSETKIVTYVNKRGERSTYPLNSAMDSANLEMVKRLKYTKDILTHMLNQNIGTVMQNPTGSRTAQQSNLGTAKSELNGINNLANPLGSEKNLKPQEGFGSSKLDQEEAAAGGNLPDLNLN